MSYWSRSMLVPLAIINHFKPTRPPQDTGQRWTNCIPKAFTSATWRCAPDPERFTLAEFFPLAGPAAQIRRMVRASTAFIRSANAR